MNVNNLKKDDLVSVSELESQFNLNLIGKNFKHKTSCYGEDILTINSKKEGFGILFFSEKFQKEYYLDSSALLRVS